VLFTSATFIAFHLALVLLRWVLPARAAGPLVLVGSYLFYVSWGARYGFLLAGMTVAGYLPARHLAPLDHVEPDFVAVAERFLGTPYLWGGKTNNGIDCSGLVQVALHACGVPCPRDSDMQERSLGTSIALGQARRGDLIFWKGHVAIVRDTASMLHANAFHMAVAIEPIAEAIARIAAGASEVTSVKRFQ